MIRPTILILCPHLQIKGGVTNFITLIIPFLNKSNYIIKCFEIGKRNIQYYKIFYPMVFLKDFLLLFYILINKKINIIHLNISLLQKSLIRDTLFFLIAKLTNKRIVISIHGWNDWIFTSSYKILLKFIIKYADCIIVLTKRFQCILNKYNFKYTNLYVIPIAIEYDKYISNKSILNHNKNILFLSNIYKDKGVYEFVRAISIIKSNSFEGINSFIIAGDGPELSNVISLCKQLNLDQKIHFTGHVAGNTKYNIFSSADVFVFPTSHGEGFPTVIAEAMAAGLPIIATPAGAIPDVIKHGINGLIISKPDPDEIANAIECLLRNPLLMKKMIDNNRIIAKQYDVSVISKRIIDVYNKILSN